MTMASFARSRVVRHTIVWLLVLGAIATLLGRTGGQVWAVLLGTLAAAIYLYYWQLTLLLQRRRYGWFLGAALAIAAGVPALLTAINNAPVIEFSTTTGEPAKVISSFGPMLVVMLLVLGVATAGYYARRAVVNAYYVQALRSQQLEAELGRLKAQVNQHFLFNTLNNLYGLSLSAPAQIPEALLQLAGLMRYQLDSSRQPLVTVGAEAEYLADYVGLEKLRLHPTAQFSFTADVPWPDQPLASLLLLPLVENCFKHAVGPGGRATIHIQLLQTERCLSLSTTNALPAPADGQVVASGLGLPNLRARLAQLYPGVRHSLHLEATATQYTAVLTLFTR